MDAFAVVRVICYVIILVGSVAFATMLLSTPGKIARYFGWDKIAQAIKNFILLTMLIILTSINLIPSWAKQILTAAVLLESITITILIVAFMRYRNGNKS